MSAIGEIRIRRTYFQCRCGKSGGSYAADNVLGLEGRYSRTLQKHACRMSADQSFEKAEENLWESMGVKVSAETLRTMVEVAASRCSGFN